MRNVLKPLYALCLLGLAANAGEDKAAEGGDAAEAETLDVATILAEPLSEDEYSETKNCLNVRAIDNVEVLDDTLVVFHGRRREIWLNQLSSQCYGLEPDMIVNLHSFGGSICRLDRFRGRHYFEPLVPITAECRLGAFETIDSLQAEALRAAVAEHREVADMAKKTKRSRRSETDRGG